MPTPKIYDISRRLHPGLAVWPGDAPFTPTWTARLGLESPVNISAFSMSTHAGTHVDAPLHYQAEGASVDQYPLLQFIGPCQVLHLHDDRPIGREKIGRWAGGERLAPRVLVRTRVSEGTPNAWEPDFPAFLPEAVAALAAQGVVLVGTDAPSVDPVDSKALAAHHAFATHGIANLENLWLADVPEGRYTLLALPLPVAGLDAAPVRAVLMVP